MNVASTCSAYLYDISRRKPSRGAPNLKQPRAPKMKIRPWFEDILTVYKCTLCEN